MAKKKEAIPEFLQKAPTGNASEFFRYFGVDGLSLTYYSHDLYFFMNGSKNILKESEVYRRRQPKGKIIGAHSSGSVNFIWVNPDNGTCWYSEIYITHRHKYQRGETDETLEIHLHSHLNWFPCNKLYENMCFLQDDRELLCILSSVNPYGERFCRENQFRGVKPGTYCVFPAMEILVKAGYKFIWRFTDSNRRDINKTEIDAFNRLCQPGTSPKTIFKTPKCIYETLKDEEDILIWDDFRKMMKLGRISKESMQNMYETGIKRKEIGFVSRILASTYQGKRVFTWDQLIRYLERVDTYEAIGMEEALHLLSDYLNMCRQLDIKPKTDSDSLKREHDVAARTCRMRRDERTARKMEGACRKMEKFNYVEKTFSATAISSYDDLVNEATQQRNCVASYAKWIAEGKSMVFKVRETAHPEKSLITVELDPKTLNVRQKYLACNRPIRSRAQSEFIDRWIRSIKKQAIA